jgi:hypothetical protein
MAAWPVCRLRPARVTRDDRQVHRFNALDVARAVETRSFGYPPITMASSVVCVSPDRPRSSTRMAVCLRRPARGPGSLSQAWIPEQWPVVCAKSSFSWEIALRERMA